MCRRCWPAPPPPVAAWDYLLNQAGNHLRAIADHHGRLPLAPECLAAKQVRGLPGSDRELAVAQANLGVAWQQVGRWDQAEGELTRALDLHARHRRGLVDQADTLDLLGGLMLDLARAGQRDRLGRAIKLYQQALAIQRRVAGRRSVTVPETLNNLGAARHRQGHQRAAARLHGAGLRIGHTILPPGDARLATGVQNLGAQFLEAGEAALAEPLLRAALAIREAAFAAQRQHPNRGNAADSLLLCLLVRARAGVNRGARGRGKAPLCPIRLRL